jgi:2-polyprenyl-3-methyl-5-hydroxy-6-metoxy-1,4-benzoquinol methylase
MSRRWTEYARKHFAAGIPRSAYNTWLSQSVSLGYLLQYRPPPARFLSIGCGMGFLDVLVASHGYSVTSIDSDPGVLEVAEHVARAMEVDLDIRQADAFDLAEFHDRYDVAFSAGLVEHWNGEHTVALIREHSRCAPLVQVEVPTVHTLKLDAIPEVIGDARLYTTREFRERVRQAGLVSLRTYTIGSVPTRSRELLESIFPPALFRRLQLATSHAMGIGVLARRAEGWS